VTAGGKAVNVLFVCTANVARSPLAAAILLELAGPAAPYAARSVGTASWAMRRLTTRDLAWADVVAVMEPRHLADVQGLWPEHAAKVRVLGVPDDYDPGEPELREVLTARVQALLVALEAGCGPGG
jgi:predicted protein tyrosine phosphatase